MKWDESKVVEVVVVNLELKLRLQSNEKEVDKKKVVLCSMGSFSCGTMT